MFKCIINNIDVDYTKCRKNPGMRAMSTLFFNSLRENFGQSSNLDQKRVHKRLYIICAEMYGS